MKKINILVIAVLLSITMLAGCSLLKTPIEIAKDDINKVLDNFQTGMVTKNVAKVVGCFTDPYIDGGNSWTHEEISAVLQEAFSYLTIYIYEFKNRLINVTGSNATVLCDLHEKTDSFEDTLTDFELIFIKTNNGWKISEIKYDARLNKILRNSFFRF